jgi:hypothetical protein
VNEPSPTIDGWRMTAAMGKKWMKAGRGTVVLKQGVWSEKLGRWMTPDEIERQGS